MATYALTINGVAKTIQPGFAITESANGRNRIDFEILSADGTYRPALDDTVILTEDGVRIFGGLVDRPVEAGFGGRSTSTGIVLRVSASDFNVFAEHIHLTAEIPSGSYKAGLQVVATALSAQGVTLDAAQATGPTLPALSYSDRPIVDVLNEMAALASGTGATSYVWEIDYTQVLRGVVTGSLAAPFNITDGDGNVLGDITVEQAHVGNFANYIVLLAGSGQKDKADLVGTADGVTVTFALHYTPAAFYVINVGGTLVDGWVTGGVNETIGTSPATWSYDPATNSITRNAALANGSGNIVAAMNAQFPLRVTADAGAPAASRVLKTYQAPDVFDRAVAQALADAYLARDNQSPKTVRYNAAFSKIGLHPGQVQTITSTKRNLTGSFLITDVRIVNVSGTLVQRQVTAVSTTRLPGTLREDFQQIFGGTGSASTAAAGTVTVVTSGGVGGTGTVGKLAKWSTTSTLGDGPTATDVLLATGSYANPSWLTSLDGSKLTGTIANAVQDNITRLGAVTVGSVPAANLSGSTLAAGVTGSSLTSVGTIVTGVWNAGAGTFAGHVLPSVTDTWDLGSATKLWRQGYISQLNAVLFAKQTQALYGGWLAVTKNAGVFAAAVASGDTTINFGMAMTLNQFVLARAADTGGSVTEEYLKVGTLVSGTTYNVTRNLSGAGAKNWPEGTPFAVRGVAGDGWLELNAFDTPRMSLFTQGSLYNNSTETIRIGHLTGMPNSSSGIGAYMGDATNYFRWDGTHFTVHSAPSTTRACSSRRSPPVAVAPMRTRMRCAGRRTRRTARRPGDRMRRPLRPNCGT